MNGMPTISALVLTYNEERHIRECLESITWCDEIRVVDSFSTDRTLEICREYTDNIVQHPFEDFASQRNYALDELPVSGDWILFMDADDRVTPELRDEIHRALKEDGDRYTGYYIRSDQWFWGKQLRYGGASQVHELRLFRKGSARCPEDKLVNEGTCLLYGSARCLKAAKIAIAKDSVNEYLSKVNHYSSLEAVRMFRTGQHFYTTASPSYSKKLQLMKAIFEKLPFRPLMLFLFYYIWQKGFLDGYRGFLYAALESIYVFAGYAKLWELKQGLVTEKEMIQWHRMILSARRGA